jgi:hypothetical protein
VGSKALAFGPISLCRAAGLSTSPTARKAYSGEAEEHHGPGCGFGGRRDAANGEVEAKAAGPVSDKSVAERQVDVGPEVGTQIKDAVLKETLGDRQAF